MAASEHQHAWVIGGSGAVGSAVVRELRARGLTCTFTWYENEAAAHELARATGARPLRFAAECSTEIEAWVEGALRDHGAPRALVYAAGTSAALKLDAIDVDVFERALKVNVTAPFLVLRALAKRHAPFDAVLVGALDRGQSLPLPVHYATTQGALGAMTMAIARELGPLGVRVNQVALGVLEDGLSRTLDAAVVQQYVKFSALRRRGTSSEVARAIAWLLLENSYVTGKVVPVNGGI
ncbi:MAG TPA: SDR family oxidoreductase [Polyangiaceae bacterium]|nr:SDR family oxidoreductase [Polyangiaceae bacterium]